jgi:protocatechuate 3,4-dioxygenase alpha subunit
MVKQTPSQTIGPFFSYGLLPDGYGRTSITSNVLTTPATKGERIRIEGTVRDGKGTPVTDAMLEIWQANAAGRYRHVADNRDAVPLDQAFAGFGRALTDSNGVFRFDTIKPGRVPGRGNALQAPHIGLILFARGMPNHAYTRVYFSDEAKANGEDSVLAAIEAPRRRTLIAERKDHEGGAVYRFDIHLQGVDETVFFDA